MTKTHATVLSVIVVLATVVASMTVPVGAVQSDVTVTDATVSQSTISAGETVAVTASVTNDGTANWTGSIELTANGTAIDTTGVTLGSGNSTTVEFNPAFDDPGTYDLAIEGVSAGTVTVQTTESDQSTADTDPQYVIDTELATDRTFTDESATVIATIENAQSENVTVPLVVTANGEEVTTTERTIPAGETVTERLDVQIRTPGSYTIGVNGVVAGTLTVEIPPQPDISVVSANVTTPSVFEDRPATILVELQNTGEGDGTETLYLLANGTVEAEASVFVAANESVTATIEMTIDDPGTYDLAVAGDSTETIEIDGTLEVRDDPSLIEECTTITESGTYRLGENLTAAADSKACIVIDADDVIFDGQGLTINGTVGAESEAKTEHYGVDVSGSEDTVRSNVTIRNLVVTEWTHGVHFEEATDVAVRDVTAVSNRVGVATKAVERATIRGGEYVENAKHGVRIRPKSEAVTVSRATISDNGDRGVFANQALGTVVRDNHVSGNQLGILVRMSKDTLVTENDVIGNVESGIQIRRTNTTEILDNRIVGGDAGILLRGHHDTGHDDTGSDHDSGDDHDHTTDDGTETTHDTSNTTEDTTITDSETDSTDDHDDETHDESDCDHETIVPGPALVEGNTIANAQVGISFVGDSNDTVVNNAVTDPRTWAVVFDHVGNPVAVEALRLDGGMVSIVGTDMGLRMASDTTAIPDGFTSLGPAIEIGEVDKSGSIEELSVEIDRSQFDEARSSPATIGLWKETGSSWQVVGATDHWRYSEDRSAWVATSLAGTSFDNSSDSIRSETVEYGVYSPIAGAVTSDTIQVAGSLSSQRIDDGDQLSVDATANNTGASTATTVLDLTADGSTVATETVSVGSKDTRRVNLSADLGPGTYEMSLSGVDLGSLKVRDVTKPTASVAIDGDALVGRTITFEANETWDDVGIVGYEWSFTDGGSARGPAVEHTFTRPGTYDVTLTVRDVAGNQRTVARTLDVSWPPSRSARSSGPSDSVSIAFHGSRSLIDISTSTSEKTFDFTMRSLGNGESPSVETLEFTVKDAGRYQVGVERTVTPPPDVPAWTTESGPAFGYVVVEGSNDGLDTVRPTISMDRDALDARDASPESLLVYKLTAGEWEPIETRVISQDDDVVRIQASSNGSTVFAAGTWRPEIATLNVALSANEIDVTESMSLSAILANSGTIAGEETVTLHVDGEPIETKTVTVSPNETVTVEFDWEPPATGSYEVAVDDVFLGEIFVTAQSGQSANGEADSGAGMIPAVDEESSPAPDVPQRNGIDPYAVLVILTILVAILGLGLRDE